MSYKGNQHRRRSFWLTFSLFFALLGTHEIWGQCDGAQPDRVFEKVSIEYRDELLKRFNLYLKYKSDKDFRSLYGILTPFFRHMNQKEEFLKDMEYYYSSTDRFVSFIPKTVGETISPLDKKADVWFIKGCLTEVISGRPRSIIRTLEALRASEGAMESIYFVDITTRPITNGENVPCRCDK